MPELTNLKPSELIRVALGYLKECEEDPRYKIDMGTWHTPDIGVCYVCLAGSVIAKGLNKKSEHLWVVSYFQDDLRDIFISLDAFRKGHILTGLAHVLRNTPYSDYRHILTIYDVRRYEEDRDGFFEDMNGLANYLESEGF